MRRSLEELHVAGISAAVHGGIEVMKYYKTEDLKIKYKRDGSPVTTADTKSHDLMIQVLDPTYLPIQSEEFEIYTGDIRDKWDYFWQIDPLDGTKEFIKQNDQFTVNVTLINKTKLVFGIIYVPVTKELYFSTLDKKAYKIVINDLADLQDFSKLYDNAQLLSIKNKKADHLILTTNIVEPNSETEELINKLKKKYPDMEIIYKGSALKFCLLAEGIANLYPRFTPCKEWDISAGETIVKAAGYTMRHIYSRQKLVYNKYRAEGDKFVVFDNKMIKIYEEID